ncbi:MAG: tryptophan synthase subunit alpha [Chloracidobacterium sp.]|nr:tryptophan synthase subunit alpha [Chloracidobacterium sp.]
MTEVGIDLISLVAPTTTDERLEAICGRARGFIYAVSRAGVTVGVGISTLGQVEEVCRFADSAVVGSAIVAEIERSISANDTIPIVDSFVRSILPQFAKTGAEN